MAHFLCSVWTHATEVCLAQKPSARLVSDGGEGVEGERACAPAAARARTPRHLNLGTQAKTQWGWVPGGGRHLEG